MTSAALLALAGAESARGVWIYGKAELAQLLLQQAWMRTRSGDERVRPWPWADTWPAARLSFPDHGRQAVVLEGASGRTLAFGPGRLHGSARPGEPGACVVAGHRDTHFSVLEDLAVGDAVELENSDGVLHVYRVTGSAVVHRDDTWALAGGDRSSLVLVTCWPFDAVAPGGPMRYVVWAEQPQGGGSVPSAGSTAACGSQDVSQDG